MKTKTTSQPRAYFLYNPVRSRRRARRLAAVGCLFFVGSVVAPVFAQLGTWRSHVSYLPGQSVAVAGNQVYAATQNGFFSFDKTTNETRVLGKQQGLSDVGITRLLYLPDQNRLFIAYRSGLIDLLSLSATGEPGSVQTIDIIATAPNLPAARAINHINRIGSNAYLSTDFGLVVFDLARNEIRDTYFSRRPNGSPLPIFQTAATTDSLFALTASLQPFETGRRLRAIRFAPTVNLADPANWRSVPEPDTRIETIVTAQNRLSVAVLGQGILERQSGRWVLTQALSSPVVRQFAGTTGVAVATSQSVTVPGAGVFAGPLLANPRELVVDGARIWVADGQNGLLSGNAGTFTPITPEGPTRDVFAQLYTYPNLLITLPAGPQEGTTLANGQPPAEAYAVPADRWLRLSAANLSRGFNSAAYLPAEQRLFLGSFGGGLWSQTAEQALAAVTLPASVGPFISSLATDRDGNLWISTAGFNTQLATLHVRRSDGQFQSFPAVNQTNIAQVVPDDNGFVWLRLDGGFGLLVFDPQTNRIRSLTTLRNEGGLLSGSIQTLVKDRNGAIWVGTDIGPTVFDNPAGAFDPVVNAQPPLLNGRRLLANEVVTAMAVDGGNRKWIGTRSGLYRVAPDGSQLLDTFTARNSPLPSTAIQALAIESTGGSVYIQTANGLISYRGPATEPAETLSALTIFPNPVRPDFTGTVGINGLTDNATVKILDAGGQLVYETRSQGGTATWNLRDYRGRTAQTGIYLVVVVSANGTEGLAGKLAVVR